VKSHTQVAVIGGGIIGCSILYHLARMGWWDVVMLERRDLTAKTQAKKCVTPNQKKNIHLFHGARPGSVYLA
jgi:glycine/D-amino acid oxidase-like deaminating enzyme